MLALTTRLRHPEELPFERATKDLPTDATGRFFVARQTMKLLRMTGFGANTIYCEGPNSIRENPGRRLKT